MNPWHDIDAKRITTEEFLVVIEIPKGSRKKYEIDKETGMLSMDRILKTCTRFPVNYGMLPKTLSEDGDPLDVFVMCMDEIHPMALVNCRPIGVIEMIDNGEADEKIIAVPLKDPQFNCYNDIGDLPENMLLEIEHFLRVYKDLEKENKVVVKPIQGKEFAVKIIEEAKMRYDKAFAKA